MVRTLEATIEGTLSWRHIDADDISGPVDNGAVEQEIAFAYGGGEYQVGDIIRIAGSLATGATIEFDLWSGLTGVFGESIQMTRLRGIMVKNLAETAGEDLAFGHAVATNPLDALFLGVASAGIRVLASGFVTWAGPLDGITVSATDRRLRLTNLGSETIDYFITLIGVRWPEPEESSSSSSSSLSSSSTEAADYSSSSLSSSST